MLEIFFAISDCFQQIVLKGGSSILEGNVWTANERCQLGPVCDDNWDERDARVVCRQLGFSGGFATVGKFM